jgi:hypothetical protein
MPLIKKNKNTYAQLNKALEIETENKARLLKTILSICKHIRIHNDFNETKLSQSLAKEWILKNPNYSEEYKSSTFSDLLPLDKTRLDVNNKEIKIPLGYKLYHQFEHKTNDNKVIQRNFQFKFDLNFVIVDVAEIINETE